MQLVFTFFCMPMLMVAVSGCSSTRTKALQNRQDRMNERTSQRAERRAIRSENADARNQALFDAM
jgi:hypothetical protein